MRPALLLLLLLTEGYAQIPTSELPVPVVPGTVGSVFPVAPTAPPGTIPPLPSDLIGAAIDRMTQGDPVKAAWYFDQWLARKQTDNRTRAAVQLARGVLYLEDGAPGLAVPLLSKARAAATPVAPWATWYLAVAQHESGQHSDAARTCSAYRATWEDGEHVDECLVLMGDAWTAAGQRGPAVAAYQEWLNKHPDSPREETLRLRIVLARSVNDPVGAIPALQELALDHSYHSTGLTAEARLQELAAKGYNAAIPQTVENECRLAAERKRCGFEEEAWQRFQSLAARAEENPAIASWIDAQGDRFQWGTKQYASLAAALAEGAKKDPEIAWKRYRAMARGGMWVEATDQLQAGMKDFPSSGRFRGIQVDLGRAQLLAGRYADARKTWSGLANSGGSQGREARWLAAFAAYRLGEHTDAISRFDTIISAGSDEALAARYFRARSLDALGRTPEADAARAAIIADAPTSWYAVLVRSRTEAPRDDEWVDRHGRWPGPSAASLPALIAPGRNPAPLAAPAASQAWSATIDWSQLGATPAATLSLTAPPPSPLAPAFDARPDMYSEHFLYDPATAWRLLDELGTEYSDVLPWARAAADLARVGLYRHAAPLVGRIYDAYEEASAGRLRSINLSAAEWRQIFLFTRDDHHVARFCYGAGKLATTAEQKLQARQCIFPTAQIDALYRHGQTVDVDPLLALGLMRQESVYRQWALSPVGAIGLMQVMPRTGGRVAALMGDPHYSPSDLEDPSINVRYGMWYLSRLLDRFGGAFPLAVGAYNGGPHNISSWLRPFALNIPLDEFVEHIPYPETRDYIKKVTGYYATYVSLYGPPGARVVVPFTITTDNAAVIDF